MKLQGGKVKAASGGVGLGSELTVILPLAQKLKADEGMTTSVVSNGKIDTVLIVEDQEGNRQILTSLLSMSGFSMMGAADGAAGVQTALNRQPDAAVIDIGLPDIDGYEVARQIRAGQGEKPMLLIALTGFGQANDIQRAMDAGFDHHLVKPLVPEDLYLLLRIDSDVD